MHIKLPFWDLESFLSAWTTVIIQVQIGLDVVQKPFCFDALPWK